MLRIDKEKIKNMKPEDVSMEELVAVHETRKSGLYNMFSPQARAMAGIDDINKWIYIMENLKDIEYHYLDELASSKLKLDSFKYRFRGQDMVVTGRTRIEAEGFFLRNYRDVLPVELKDAYRGSYKCECDPQESDCTCNLTVEDII